MTPRLFACMVPLVVAAVLTTFALPADGLDRRQFLSGAPFGGTTFDCSYRARSGLVASASSRNFTVRPRQTQLTVAAVQGVAVNAATIDQRLADASTLIQASQGPGDVTCCYAMRRDGAIGAFQAPAGMVGGVITTAAESNAVFAANADIKVVAGISFCGQVGTYAGCANGSTLIVVQNTGAATYAHEVGHLAGLCHVATSCTPTCGQAGDCTDCTDPSSDNIMYYRMCGGAQGVISSKECSAFTGFGTP